MQSKKQKFKMQKRIEQMNNYKTGVLAIPISRRRLTTEHKLRKHIKMTKYDNAHEKIRNDSLKVVSGESRSHKTQLLLEGGVWHT